MQCSRFPIRKHIKFAQLNYKEKDKASLNSQRIGKQIYNIPCKKGDLTNLNVKSVKTLKLL